MLNKRDIVTVIENEGFELKDKGKYLWGLCPLHSERYPSFKVDPQRQSFYCFGCGAHGDVITFIQKYRGLSFKGALEYLGINGRPHKPDSKETKRKELLQQFREWCDDYYNDLCQLVRTLYKAMQNAKTVEKVEVLAPFYHLESLWLCEIEILQNNDDQAKFELYKKVVYGS